MMQPTQLNIKTESILLKIVQNDKHRFLHFNHSVHLLFNNFQWCPYKPDALSKLVPIAEQVYTGAIMVKE